MVAAFVFNDTVHEWGHDDELGGHSPKVRGWKLALSMSKGSWMIGVGTPTRPPPNRRADLGEGNEQLG